MLIRVNATGGASLEEAGNFKGFSIAEESPGCAGKFSGVIESAPDNHYWLDAETVIALSPQREDAEWTRQFWEMLRKAEPYGYADVATKRVKAHVE